MSAKMMRGGMTGDSEDRPTCTEGAEGAFTLIVHYTLRCPAQRNGFSVRRQAGSVMNQIVRGLICWSDR
jgi:hypothetical protein